MLDPAAPQLVVQCRTLYVSWLPADPDAVAALVPAGLHPRPDRQVFMNQYVVDDATQSSGLGPYSLTYLGVTLAGLDAPGGHPGGWWTHYLASSPLISDYAAARGAPAAPGRTTIEVRGEELASVTEAAGQPLIRARCRVGDTGHQIHSGHHRFLTRRDGEVVSAVYPFIAEPVAPFEIESVEFLDPGHPAYALRPANPLTIAWGFYAPRSSFAHPGGLTSWPLPEEPVADPPRPRRAERDEPAAGRPRGEPAGPDRPPVGHRSEVSAGPGFGGPGPGRLRNGPGPHWPYDVAPAVGGGSERAGAPGPQWPAVRVVDQPVDR
ncbi:hypothetical protein [Micromonospora sp. PLK6-60]|uniref:hypothetical protein n=1 Tax=Micromonospora sp. PLK6-60 TaxID=2873383 RepID=UPI0021045BDD|nr:hypothetical protein [Micromonospora sp. PLK6-60]